MVEDDDDVGDALVEVLEEYGYRAERKSRGADLLLGHRNYDAVVLDLGLPDGDGLDVLRKLREVSTVPVVILTARDDERSVVRGLRIGADDYLVKPPRVAELIARLEAVVRRANPVDHAGADRVVVTGDVRVDLGAREVTVGDARVDLTQKEFELVEVIGHRGRDTCGIDVVCARAPGGGTSAGCAPRTAGPVGQLRLLVPNG
nr:response regulator transcription factor [Nocardia fusca]